MKLVLLGYPLTPLLVAKLVLVAALWVMGPLIDNVVEPRFRKLASESAAPAFQAARGRYLAWETLAIPLFYVITVTCTASCGSTGRVCRSRP